MAIGESSLAQKLNNPTSTNLDRLNPKPNARQMTQKDLYRYQMRKNTDNGLQLSRVKESERDLLNKNMDGSSRHNDSPRKSPRSQADYMKGSTQKSMKVQSNKHDQQSSTDFIAFKQSLISGRSSMFPRPSGEQSSAQNHSNNFRQSHIDGNSSDAITGGLSKSQLANRNDSAVNAGGKAEQDTTFKSKLQIKRLTREKQRQFHQQFTKKPEIESDDIKIKKNIEKLDAQDITRNTRFFKDLLKDKMREQLKRGSTIMNNNGTESEK